MGISAIEHKEREIYQNNQINLEKITYLEGEEIAKTFKYTKQGFFNMFEFLVVLIAIVYVISANYLRKKLIDFKLIEEIKQETKQLNKEMEEARKRKDQKAMKEVLQKQMGLLPKSQKLLFSQLKYTFAIIIVFFAIIGVIDYLDPYTKDDITITLRKGEGCAGPEEFAYCFTPQKEGTWLIRAEALKEGKSVGKSEKVFYYGEFKDEGYAEKPQGNGAPEIEVKERYAKGEEVVIKIRSKAEEVKLTLNNATYFMVELPITIPLINVKKIYQPYWWFILSSFLISMTYTVALKAVKK